MKYDLMLMADPGPTRDRVLQLFHAAPDITVDGEVENRLWLTTPHGKACINIGTKDPVESIQVEFDYGDMALAEVVTHRSLDLAEALEMYVEDVQWGREVGRGDLDALRQHWNRELKGEKVAAAADAPRPWWKLW